jgi:hypothetical protein
LMVHFSLKGSGKHLLFSSQKFFLLQPALANSDRHAFKAQERRLSWAFSQLVLWSMQTCMD